MKVIDFHAHIFPEAIAPKAVKHLEEYYKMHWSCTGVIDDIADSMNISGVEKCVIFSTPTKPQQVLNVNNSVELDRYYPLIKTTVTIAKSV